MVFPVALITTGPRRVCVKTRAQPSSPLWTPACAGVTRLDLRALPKPAALPKPVIPAKLVPAKAGSGNPEFSRRLQKPPCGLVISQLRGLPEARELENKPIEAKSLVFRSCIQMEANKHMPGNLKSFRGLQPFQPRTFEFSNVLRFFGGRGASEGENEAKRSQCDKLFVIR